MNHLHLLSTDQFLRSSSDQIPAFQACQGSRGNTDHNRKCEWCRREMEAQGGTVPLWWVAGGDSVVRVSTSQVACGPEVLGCHLSGLPLS